MGVLAFGLVGLAAALPPGNEVVVNNGLVRVQVNARMSMCGREAKTRVAVMNRDLPSSVFAGAEPDAFADRAKRDRAFRESIHIYGRWAR